MDTPGEGSIVQKIFGQESRNAGRDYHEILLGASVKDALYLWPKDKLDQTAIGNGNFFRARFGFKATPAVRQQIVDFQNRYDLLDEEIRWARWAGYLSLTRTGYKLDASAMLPAYGWVHLILISLICTCGIFEIAFSGAPEWKQAVGQIVTALAWFAIGALVSKLFILPRRAFKRAGAFG